MQLKTRLYILLLSVVLIFGATFGGVFFVDSRISTALSENEQAFKIVKEVSQLHRLVTELHRGGVSRVKKQWGIKFLSLNKTINEYKAAPFITSKMGNDLKKIDKTFHELVETFHEEIRAAGTKDFESARFYRYNHLTVLLYSLSYMADTLATENFRKVDSLQRDRDIFLLFLGFLWCCAVLVWSYALWTRFMTPMRSLLGALRVVGSGDLGHRVNVVGNGSEMNMLLQSFNTMLDRLEGLVCSRRQILDATEQERSRISRELHDGICQNLAAIGLKFKSIPNLVQSKEAKRLATELSRTQTDIKRIIKDLRPSMLDELGLLSTLHWLGEQNYDQIEFNLHLYANEQDIPQRLRIPIFRIVQEAVSNAINHGKASEIYIQLNIDDSTLNLSIEDNGNGFIQKEISIGNGLINIRERVESEGGDISIESSPGRGCCLIVSFPLVFS